MIAQSYEEVFYLFLFIYLFIHIFIYLFIYLFTYLLIYILSVIERCHLLGGNLKKTVTFGANCFVAIQAMPVIWDVRYWEISLYYLGSNVNF